MSTFKMLVCVVLVGVVSFAWSDTGTGLIYRACGYRRALVSPDCVPLAFARDSYVVRQGRVLYRKDGVVWLKDSEDLLEYRCGKKEASSRITQYRLVEGRFVAGIPFELKVSYEIQPDDARRLVEAGINVRDLDEHLLWAVSRRADETEFALFIRDKEFLATYCTYVVARTRLDKSFSEVKFVQKLKAEIEPVE